MNTVPLFQIDAFTREAFRGNPAAVCLLQQEADASWMQALAMEMNLSETAFVWPQTEGFGLRWFTPAVEVKLCGHATLATAHVLWQQGWLKPGQIAQFHTKSGLLTAQQQDGLIVLNFPATIASPADEPPGLLAALGLTEGTIYSNGTDYLVQVADETQVRQLQPNFAALKLVQARGVMVTAASQQPQYDFVSRFFAPAVGVNEDPATGSAHCALAPFWAERLGKTKLSAFQASARGGELVVEALGARVTLAGSAVTIFEGRLAC